MDRRLLALALVAAAACHENRSSLEIRGRAAPSSATTCTFTGGGETLLGIGVMDVGSFFGPPVFEHRYRLHLYVKNTLTDPSTDNPQKTASSKAWFPLAAKVRVNPSGHLSDFGLGAGLLPLGGEIVTTMDGNAVEVGTEGVVTVEAVDVTLGNTFSSAVTGAGGTGAGRVVLGVTLKGFTGDGASLESGEWFFPIDLCEDCLVPAVACANGVVNTNCEGFGQDTTPACAP
jgi:hypothetical protein